MRDYIVRARRRTTEGERNKSTGISCAGLSVCLFLFLSFSLCCNRKAINLSYHRGAFAARTTKSLLRVEMSSQRVSSSSSSIGHNSFRMEMRMLPR